MFKQKQKTLFTEKTTTSEIKNVTNNVFIDVALRETAKTLSENGALKFSTTGSPFVDQFGKLGSYKVRRSFDDISLDMSTLYGVNREMAIKFTIYMRLITRKVKLFNGDETSTVQRGAGLKHESIVRMIWLFLNDKEAFYTNIGLFISAGSWNDIIQMLGYDLQYNGWDGRVLDWGFMGKLILSGLYNPNTTNLVRKYLPQIKSNSKCKTIESQSDNIIAKWICSLLFGLKSDAIGSNSTYKLYREIKSHGNAHKWQQLISQGKHDLIDFDTVHGRALALMVSGKYIDNNGLVEKYEKWIESKPVAKFTGYVHELFNTIPSKKYQINTLNSQFKGLVETAKKNAKTNTGLIVVRDTSASMGSIAVGTKMSCFDIAKALALYFSEMLSDGHFANSWIEFNSTAKLKTWVGDTPYQKWVNDRSGYVGSTNFLSVINLLCLIKESGVDESEFPTGILCISDSEFNPTQLNTTNVQAARKLLHEAGFNAEFVDNFKIILWNLQGVHGSGGKFETYGNVSNVYYFSGYDASTIAFLTGIESAKGEIKSEPKNAEELFLSAMSQELLDMVYLRKK